MVMAWEFPFKQALLIRTICTQLLKNKRSPWGLLWLKGLRRESSYLEITLRNTFTFLLEDWCQRLYEKRLLDKYPISDYTSKSERNGTLLLLGYKSNWICSLTKVLKTMVSNTVWDISLSSMSNVLLHTLSCAPGSFPWYSIPMPLICYILICKSRSRHNLPEVLLLTPTLQASVKPSYHTKNVSTTGI